MEAIKAELLEKATRDAAPHELFALQDMLLMSGEERDILDTALLTFHIRNPRGGKGERRLFHLLFRNLGLHMEPLAEQLLDLIPEYGCWRDIFQLYDIYPAMRHKIEALILAQLRNDEAALVAGTPERISLLAKWAPREGHAHADIAKSLAMYFWMYDADRARSVANSYHASYRKRLAALNRALLTVEIYECANQWGEIEPANVPYGARQKKRYAYLNQCGSSPILRRPDDEGRMECREKFLEYFGREASVSAPKYPSSETMAQLYNNPLYQPLRDRTVAWLKGGWRGIL